MNNLCTDIGHMSLTKYGEELCGDMVEVIEHGDDDYVVVLADGLGSGVKANILSTLTSKIISTMIANNMPLEMCVDTIAKTLPICSVPNTTILMSFCCATEKILCIPRAQWKSTVR